MSPSSKPVTSSEKVKVILSGLVAVGEDCAQVIVTVGAVVSRLVETSTVTADEIAAAVLEGMDRGDEVIVPDEAARMAWGLKQADRPAYDAVMRAQAAKLEEQS